MKKLALALLLCTSSLFGIGLGSYRISPEFGINLSYQKEIKNSFTYGGYARLWLGFSRIVIAPQFKYDVITQSNNISAAYKNMQIGGLLGFDVPILPLLPYIGASYSSFQGINLESTYSFNYGVRIGIPLVPLLFVGIDGSWQKPKVVGGTSYNMNRIGATIGIEF